MHNPFRVAVACADAWPLIVARNQPSKLWNKEGQFRPSHAMSNSCHHIHFWTRPTKAKPASSQGEALAKNECEQPHLETHLKDMKMEFSS